MTLLDLAMRSGVATSTVQKVEKGQMVPTIAVLMKIAKGLRRRASYLLGEEDGETEVAFRSGSERTTIASSNGVRLERLAADISDPDFDAYEIIVPPGKSSGRSPLQHRGDELVLCLEGRIDYLIGDRCYTLEPGDSLHFKSALPHRWRNKGTKTVRLVMVGSYPGAFKSV